MNLKKILALVLCAVLLVGGSVLGTMAYLTSQDAVTNTFTVGNVAITLDETDVDDSDKDGSVTDRDQANAYHLLPGQTYTKDPIIHVADGSEKCWLFVEIVNEIADIEAGTTIAAQMDANGWTPIAEDSSIYFYENIVDASADAVDVDVFETFTIKGDVANKALADYNGMTIKVTAYAVQAAGFATAAAAWAATFGAPVTDAAE